MAKTVSYSELLFQNSYPFTLKDGQLTGKGADFLQTAVQTSQFFMIGEEHGVAEIPLAAAALFRKAAEYGYDHLGIEVGPFTTQGLSDALAQDGLAGLRQHIQADPLTIPFYSWQEDAQLLHTAYAASRDPENALWGVDQESMFSACYFLEQVRLLAPDAGAQEKSARVANRARELRRKGLPCLFVVPEAGFAELKSLFGQEHKAAKILDALETSYHIYALFYQAMQGKQEAEYLNNVARESLIKKHFLRYYKEAAARRGSQHQPRVLLRMGFSHLSRGLSPTKIHSLGNLLAELAVSNENQAFNIYMMAGPETEVQTVLQGRQPARDAQKLGLTPVLQALDPSAWTLFDLRPLRPLLYTRQVTAVNPALEAVIWQCDALAVFANSTPATNLVA